MILDLFASVGWIQSIALAAVMITPMAIIAIWVSQYMETRRDLQMKELEHKQKIVEDMDD